MIIKTFVLVENNDHFLLIREAASKWKGKWFLPGGNTEPGESPIEGAMREVKEETGYEVHLKGIFYIRFHERLFRKQISIFYCGKITGGKPKKKADKHSLEVKWFTYNEIRTLPLRQKLLDILISYNPKKAMPIDNFKLYV